MKKKVDNQASPNVIPVVATMSADLLTPVAIYLKLSAAAEHSFLLESVAGGENLARYSFIGASPRRIVRGNDRQTVIEDAGEAKTLDIGFFEYIRTHFSAFQAIGDAELPSFIGGAIGYLGFDCCGWFETSLAVDDGGSHDAAMMFFDSIVAFDHARQVIKIISLVFTDDALSEQEQDGLMENARKRNIEIEALLHGEVPYSSSPGAVPLAREVPHPTDSNFSQIDFEAAVEQVKELIVAGECYQVVLSQRFSRQTEASATEIYRALRSLNPSPYMFLLEFGSKAVIGASPEMLVRCEGSRVEYRPIAGTRKRGSDADEDTRLADDLRTDKKEVAEHVMLVDLGRNDLGRVADHGSVQVDTLMSVEKYSHVQHLVSSLSARLRPPLDRFDALAACFPAGTVSGAPKVRAIEILRKLEPTPRGIYAGAIGYFDYAGNMDTCIAIRTLVLENGIATVQAGCGIVADSVPSLEYEESVHKAKGLLLAVEIAENRRGGHGR